MKNNKNPIYVGAEANLYKEGDVLIKDRISKKYRIKEIDHLLRKRRTKIESRILSKAKRFSVNVPRIIETDNALIKMEFIEGGKVKDILNNENYKTIGKKIGKSIAFLHMADIIHGDLTTSNMIIKDSKLFMIDFGLSFHSKRIEDKAVDLHLLKQVLESTHFEIYEKMWELVLKTYLKEYNTEEANIILNTITKIEKRGRYK